MIITIHTITLTDVAQIICDAHEIINSMIAQFQPSIDCKPGT